MPGLAEAQLISATTFLIRFHEYGVPLIFRDG